MELSKKIDVRSRRAALLWGLSDPAQREVFVSWLTLRARVLATHDHGEYSYVLDLDGSESLKSLDILEIAEIVEIYALLDMSSQYGPLPADLLTSAMDAEAELHVRLLGNLMCATL